MAYRIRPRFLVGEALEVVETPIGYEQDEPGAIPDPLDRRLDIAKACFLTSRLETFADCGGAKKVQNPAPVTSRLCARQPAN